MNTKTLIYILGAMLLTGGNSWAADDAEATIRLMGKAESELPDAVTKKIELPEHLRLLAADPEDQEAVVGKAENGLAKANERQAHREQGQDQAAEARERNAEMKEGAKENRESRGRSEDHPTPPETPPGQN